MNAIKKSWKAKFFALSACAGALAMSAPQAHAGLFSLSEKDEIEAGRQAKAQAEKEYGRALPASDPMSRRVSAIGQEFARLSTRKNIPYSYTVLQNDKVLNAFAAPGGPVFVTTRLMKTTSNDAELAYVLGHETGHIERRHIAKAVEKQQTGGLFVGILGAVLGRGKGGNILGTVLNGTFAVWQSGYSRDNESEADAVGVRWMSQLGYDPRAATTMLAKLGDGGNSSFLDKYLATHPDPNTRIKRVNAEIQKENLVDVARRSGGPRLSDANNDGYRYANSNDNGYAANNNYPNTVANDYPDYNAGNNVNNNRANSNNYGREIVLEAPLRVVDYGNGSVLLAPVTDIARWAGARLSVQGTQLTLTRAGHKLELRRNSTVAWDNGKKRTLSVAVRTFDGKTYAPLGDLVEGMGGRARFDNASNSARISLDNGPEDSIPLR